MTRGTGVVEFALGPRLAGVANLILILNFFDCSPGLHIRLCLLVGRCHTLLFPPLRFLPLLSSTLCPTISLDMSAFLAIETFYVPLAGLALPLPASIGCKRFVLRFFRLTSLENAAVVLVNNKTDYRVGCEVSIGE